MQLSGLQVNGFIRITQATNNFDVKFKLDSTNTTLSNIDSNFYAALFFDLLAGNVTGVDGGGALTGFKFKIFKTDNTTFCTSSVAGKLDWYETENTYISEASSTIASQAVSADTWIKEVELIYVANNASVNKEIPVLVSNVLGSLTFSTNDLQSTPVKGLKLATAGGAAAITCTIQFVIAQ